jgi:AraC-like DNA-binding protein
MKRKLKATAEPPVYSLDAFGTKAGWTDFYIEKFNAHVAAHPFVGKPHKHDFYLILFVAKGGGTHTIDFTTYDVRDHSMFLMTPGQVHNWSLTPQTDGFVVFFTQSFYQMQMVESNLLEFPFYHALNASPVIQIDESEAITFVLTHLLRTYGRAKPELRMLRAYLDVLLLEAAQYYKNEGLPETHGAAFRLRKLEHLINQHYAELKRPSDYAELMNLAPTYLNSICKNSLGKTLTELIHSRVLLEAKRLLAYSDLTINEIAIKLGYADASYFTRWFGKYGGTRPDEFRRSYLS